MNQGGDLNTSPFGGQVPYYAQFSVLTVKKLKKVKYKDEPLSKVQIFRGLFLTLGTRLLVSMIEILCQNISYQKNRWKKTLTKDNTHYW